MERKKVIGQTAVVREAPSAHFRVVELLSDSVPEMFAHNSTSLPYSLKGRSPEQSPGREEIGSAGTASDSAAGVLPDQCADPERQRGGAPRLMNCLVLAMAVGGRGVYFS